MKTSVVALCCLGAFLSITVVKADQVKPVAYDMPNGNTGSYNYWDESYNGPVGNPGQDGSFLAGGVGDLTDGVIAADNWYVTEAPAGPGPYVGWMTNPTILFRFASPQAFDKVTLYLDDSNGAGGVSAPAAVQMSLDGGPASPFTVPEPSGSAPFAFTIPLNTTAQSISLTLERKNGWVFMSEVTFDRKGGSSVPDTGSSLLLLGIGLCALVGGRLAVR